MAIKTKPVKLPHPDAVERRELRTSHSKTFAMPDGRMRCDVKVGTIQHYRDDDGAMRTCDTTIQEDSGKVFVDWLPYKFRLHNKGIGFDFQSRESGRCSVSLASIGGVPFARTQKLTPTIESDKITFTEVVPGIDIVFRVLPARVKSWRIIKNANAPRTFEWLCEHDADGRDKISDKLIGKDAAGNQLELVGEAVPIDATSFRFVETWTGKVKLRDKKTRVKTLSSEAVYPVEIDPTVTSSPTATADDGTQFGPLGNIWDQTFTQFGMYLHNYQAGVRFPSVNVPQGATITSATLTIKVNNVYPVAGSGTIYGVATDNAVAFSGSNLPTAASKTTASTTISSAAVGTRNYTVTSIIQEIVNRAGWVATNAIAMPIINTGYGYSRIDDYQDAGSNQASLSITYTSGAPSTGTKHWRPPQPQFLRPRITRI